MAAPPLPCVSRISMDKDQGPVRRALPDRAPVRQGSVMKLGKKRPLDGIETISSGLARARHRARRRRLAARPGGGNLWAGILRQERWRCTRCRGTEKAASAPSSTRTRARPGLCRKARRQYRRALESRSPTPASRRGSAHSALRRGRRAGDRFGRLVRAPNLKARWAMPCPLR